MFRLRGHRVEPFFGHLLALRRGPEDDAKRLGYFLRLAQSIASRHLSPLSLRPFVTSLFVHLSPLSLRRDCPGQLSFVAIARANRRPAVGRRRVGAYRFQCALNALFAR
jgi:hypothetical protein